MIFEHSRILNENLRADITPSFDGKSADVAIRGRHAPENGRVRAAAGIIFLHTGDTFVSYSPNVNAAEPALRMPDDRGNADPAIAALAYTAATLPHPAGENAPQFLRFDIPALASPKVRANLEALGMVASTMQLPPEDAADQGALPDLRPWHIDAYGRTHWADDLPAIAATELAWTIGGDFEAANNAPVSPAPAGITTAN